MDWYPLKTAPKDGTRILAGRYSYDGEFHPNVIGWVKTARTEGWREGARSSGYLYSDDTFQIWAPIDPPPAEFMTKDCAA